MTNHVIKMSYLLQHMDYTDVFFGLTQNLPWKSVTLVLLVLQAYCIPHF
jgi:hypothetical protein